MDQGKIKHTILHSLLLKNQDTVSNIYYTREEKHF